MSISIETDLRSLLGPARDQGPRPTCLAFAMSDAHAAVRGDTGPLSCEYLYYESLALSGALPTSGTTLPSCCAALKAAGQPVEAEWPYLSVAPEDMPSDWGAPDGIGALYRRVATEQPGDCMLIRRAIDSQVPVVAIIVLCPSFYQPGKDGLVEMKTGEALLTKFVHAVLCVGLGTINGASAFLVRNSWGAAWGLGGHAWIFERDMKRLLISVAELGEDPDVPNNPFSA